MYKITITDIPEDTSLQAAAEAMFTLRAQNSVTSISEYFFVDTNIFSSNRSYKKLQDENERFSGTGGISQNNYEYGFIPAFRNEMTEQVLVSKTANGDIAPVHLLDGIPVEWFASPEVSNAPLVLLDTITSGFVRQGIFYTREEAANAVKIFNLEDD